LSGKSGGTLLLLILSLIELHVWLAANGYGGIQTMLAKFISE
jgi:hypothetical protein